LQMSSWSAPSRSTFSMKVFAAVCMICETQLKRR
jgi:hypothetical protein